MGAVTQVPLIGDIDGDGRDELLVPAGAGVVTLWSYGAGGFASLGTWASGSGASSGWLLADVDGDGKAELLIPETAGMRVVFDLAGDDEASEVWQIADGTAIA